MPAQHVLQPVDLGVGEYAERQRDVEILLAPSEDRAGDLHADDLRLLLTGVEPAPDHEHGVVGEHLDIKGAAFPSLVM